MAQQLLLIILVVVIVGIGTVIAIDSMNESRTESRKSAIRQDILLVINDAQTYYQKPAAIGGGNQSFDDISEANIRSIKPTNENGSYQISGSGSTVTITGTGTNNIVKLTTTASISQGGVQISWADSTQ